jgi:hypothetical protein
VLSHTLQNFCCHHAKLCLFDIACSIPLYKTMRITVDEVSDALFTLHEISCALKMHLLTSLFEPTIASYIACVGRHRMMVPSNFLRVFAMTRMIPNTAWLLLLHLRYSYKVELPILPHLCWNLNDVIDAECNKYFSFSHRNIQMLVTKLEFPDVLITDHTEQRSDYVC